MFRLAKSPSLESVPSDGKPESHVSAIHDQVAFKDDDALVEMRETPKVVKERKLHEEFNAKLLVFVVSDGCLGHDDGLVQTEYTNHLGPVSRRSRTLATVFRIRCSQARAIHFPSSSMEPPEMGRSSWMSRSPRWTL